MVKESIEAAPSFILEPNDDHITGTFDPNP
jgi:hypothetical protein